MPGPISCNAVVCVTAIIASGCASSGCVRARSPAERLHQVRVLRAVVHVPNAVTAVATASRVRGGIEGATPEATGEGREERGGQCVSSPHGLCWARLEAVQGHTRVTGGQCSRLSQKST